MENQEIENKAIAIIYYPEVNKTRAIMPTFGGGLYFYWIDYTGLFACGATSDCSNILLELLYNDIKTGRAKIIKSPFSLYHVWHVCMCPECNKHGGKIFDHSQANFNEHFRNVKSEDVFTFPSA